MKSTHTQSRNLEGMAKPRRRHLHNVVAVLAVLVGLAAFGSPTAVLAQNFNESNVASQNPEGSWLYTVTIPNSGSAPTVFQGIETYSAGGGYVEADQLSFTYGYLATAGHGAWASTGNNTFLLTYINLTYDGAGNATGSSKVRQTTRISGNSYSGSGDYSYYDLNGEVVASGTFTITAKRILVQAPK
jgi:hypothetical protein